MAKTSYIDISPESSELYYKGLQSGDRFTFSRVVRKNLLLSRNTKINLAGRSLFGIIAEYWRAFSSEQKNAWSAAADEIGITGWQLFIQDQAARLANSMSGVATPSLLHQSWVGQLHIESPATEAKIVQLHPRSYYVKRKVTGTKSQYSPVLVTEDFILPFQIGLNYKSNLSSAGADPYAKMYALVWYSYQGVNLEHTLEIPLNLVADWNSVSETLSSLETIVVGYNLYIHLHDVTGDLYFDNIKAVHGGQNWARDPFCREIDAEFSRNFYQVPRSWAAEIADEGVDFESVYKDF